MCRTQTANDGKMFEHLNIIHNVYVHDVGEKFDYSYSMITTYSTNICTELVVQNIKYGEMYGRHNTHNTVRIQQIKSDLTLSKQ